MSFLGSHRDNALTGVELSERFVASRDVGTKHSKRGRSSDPVGIADDCAAVLDFDGANLIDELGDSLKHTGPSAKSTRRHIGAAISHDFNPSTVSGELIKSSAEHGPDLLPTSGLRSEHSRELAQPASLLGVP